MKKHSFCNSDKIVFRFVTIVAFFFLLSFEGYSQIKSPKKIPVLQEAGKIPVQWESTKSGVSASIQKEMMDQAFKKAIENSTRFRMLNDDLVGELWTSVDGRARLEQEYEADALLGLTVVNEDDRVQLQFRVLNPRMEVLILETEVRSKSWISASTQSEMNQAVSDLVAKGLNRIPMDVSITSVQGRYITLSGGSRQNIVVGDKLDLIRASVAGVHPADGSWMQFKVAKIGSAEIIETNEYSSVAKIIGLSYENAAEVGDGAKIPSLNTRRQFQKKDSLKEVKPAEDDRRIIYEPAPQSNKVEDKSKEEERENQEGIDLSELLAAKANDVTIKFGFEHWSAKGTSSATAPIPSLLINHLAAKASRDVGENLYGEGEVSLDFGSTKNGGFMGIGANVLVAHKDEAHFLDSFLQSAHWYGGGLVSLSTIGVSEESFGGMDILTLGARVGLLGKTEFLKRETELSSSFSLIPLGFGQVGAGGKKYAIGSMFENALDFTAIIKSKSLKWDFGGELKYTNSHYGLAGSRNIHEFKLSVLGLARYTF